MDTDIWRALTAAVRSVDRRVPRTGRRPQYTDQLIVKMCLWAVWHDRPLCWACDRSNYTGLFRPRQLPSVSQFCRRVKTPRVQEMLTEISTYLSQRQAAPRLTFFDGKPLPIGDYSRDPDARDGRGAGRFQRGYKLHALTSVDGRILRFAVRSLNEGEPNTAREALVEGIPPKSLVLADTNYDSAALYTAVGSRDSQLLTPLKGRSQKARRRRAMGVRRRSAIEWWENCPDACEAILALRGSIERTFSSLTCFGGGLTTLPPWVRRIHRVTCWVTAKIAVYNARLLCRKLVA